MKYLLDTHAMLWITNNDRISNRVEEIYSDKANELYLSAVSIWELAIKISLSKLTLPQKLSLFITEHVIGNDVGVLEIEVEHLYPLESLPLHHRDPFDRLLICQSLSEKMPLISKDNIFEKYGVERIW